MTRKSKPELPDPDWSVAPGGPAAVPYVAERRAAYGAQAAPLDPRVLMVRAFLQRYVSLLQRVGEAASEQAIARALSATDDVGGLAELLAEVAPLEPPAPDPLAAARARGASAKGELLKRAGGGLRLAEAARRLGVTPQAVHARRKRGTLLAVPLPNGEFVYPACQLAEDGALPGLTAVLDAFAVQGPWTRLSVLLSPAPSLGGRTPLQALAAGDVAGAAEAVAAYGEQE